MQETSAACVIIGLAGGSGSGKTTVAHRVLERFPGRPVGILAHDSYYHDQPDLDADHRARTNYDHPGAFQTDLLVEHLVQLRAGGTREAKELRESARSLDSFFALSSVSIRFLEVRLPKSDQNVVGRKPRQV